MFKYMNIVLKKEIIDIMRDKKTLITSFLIPILIFPIMAFAMGASVSEVMKDTEKPVPIYIQGEVESGFGEYLTNSQDTNVVESKNPEKSLEKLDIYAIVTITPEFLSQLQNKETANLEILYDESSQKSISGLSKLNKVINDYSQKELLNRLSELGLEPSILEVVNIESKSVTEEDGQNGLSMMLVSMLVPMMLAIWASTGCIAPATDLGAGEKERQTLEPLLTTNVSRTSLLFGKYFAVVISGILATFASLIGMGLATRINPSLFATVSISPSTILIIALAAIGLTLTFAAIELAISFYARNFKEAQTYLTPITFIVLIPAYFTMYLDGKVVPSLYFHIPIINTISIMKETLVSIYNPMHIGTVFIWTLIYIALSIAFVLSLFKNENVIFRN